MFKFLYNINDVYKPTFKLYHYQGDLYRLVFFNCRQQGYERKTRTPKISNELEKERTSLSRTKRSIREICLCNDFTYFCTITINSINCDRFSLQQCQDLLHKTLYNYSRLKNHTNKFKYIFITEKHKNGAFHFHGLVTSLCTTDIYTNDNGFLSSHYLEDRIGFVSFSPIKDILKCSNYITKYITKDCVRNENNQIYFCSKGLARADVSYVSAQSFEDSQVLDKDFWSFTNDYCKIKDFYFKNLTPLQQTVIFNNTPKFS